MKNNPWFYFSMIILVFMGSCTYMFTGMFSEVASQGQFQAKTDSILVLELEGVIIDGKKILKEIRDYAHKDNIKGVLVRVNSPGGVVGPSQEIYHEIKNIRDVLEKPVYISANGLMASGAFYAAMGASKIYSNSGSLLGSIGVIMNFANLEDLYKWAKVKRFNLTTGKFKDTGSDFRNMRSDEKDYLNKLLSESLDQFIRDILLGRKNLKEEKVRAVADGRVFTGDFAKSYGFIDEVGSFSDAIKAIGVETGLGESPKLFHPKKSPEEFFEMLSKSMKSMNPAASVEKVFQTKLLGRPLFIFPQYLGNE